MPKAPRKPAAADLPVLTEVPEAEADLPVLTEILAEQAPPPKPAAEATPPPEAKAAPESRPAPAPRPKTGAVPLTEAQCRQVAEYIAPQLEKLLRDKIAARMNALWPEVWKEVQSDLPGMVRTVIVESARRTRK